MSGIDFTGWIASWQRTEEKPAQAKLQEIVRRDTDWQATQETVTTTLTDEAQAAVNQVQQALERARAAFHAQRSGPIAKAHMEAIEGAMLLAEQTATAFRGLEHFEGQAYEFHRRTGGRMRTPLANRDLTIALEGFVQRARRAIEEPRAAQSVVRRAIQKLDFSDLFAR